MTKKQVQVEALQVAYKIANEKWTEAVSEMKERLMLHDQKGFDEAWGKKETARDITLAINKAIEAIRGY